VCNTAGVARPWQWLRPTHAKAYPVGRPSRPGPSIARDDGADFSAECQVFGGEGEAPRAPGAADDIVFVRHAIMRIQFVVTSDFRSGVLASVRGFILEELYRVVGGVQHGGF
jgi:hypothetical protein